MNRDFQEQLRLSDPRFSGARMTEEGLDVTNIPTVAIGHRNVSWLGNVLYMTIEGTMFALLIASYFYLRTRAVNWPPAGVAPPLWGFGMMNLAIFLISLAPARWIQTQAVHGSREHIRIGLIILATLAAIAIALRWFEFKSLQCRWSDNAYASSIWVLLGIHTGHLITEWIETLVVTAISFTDKMEGMRFADASMNSDYWYFVVATAGIVDLIIYGTTRWL